MADFTEKNYAKFFGKNLFTDILEIDPELTAELKAKLQTKQVVESFDSELALILDEVLELDAAEINMIYEENLGESLEPGEQLHNFFSHLSSPWMNMTRSGRPGKKRKKEIDEANSVADIQAKGREALDKQGGNPFAHMKAGFHAAFPEGEHPKETARKATEAQNHFHQFMHERGGHSKDNKLKMLGNNGKTRKSSGEGVKTVGLSMAPSKHSGYNHDICPKASKECRTNCIGLTAGGNARYPESALRSKVLRTHYVHEHPEHAARLISHEISHNEKAADKIKHKSGVRLNVTSDIPYEHLMPKKFFEKHHKSQFYDYTKIPGRLHNKNKPENYHLSLSHTGTGHGESNDKDVVHALKHGHVVAMVHHRGKDTPHPTHVEDVQSGHRYPIANGDHDDNTFDRHAQLGIKHKLGVGEGEHSGVVSGLRLKGVTNERAGKFANRVDPDGIIRINHPKPEGHVEKKENPFHVLK